MEKASGQLAGIALGQVQLNAGKLGLVDRQDLGQDEAPSCVGDADGELSGGKILDVPDLLVGLIPQIQDLPGLGLQRLPCVGQGQGGGAVKEHHIEFLFQVGDVVA